MAFEEITFFKIPDPPPPIVVQPPVDDTRPKTEEELKKQETTQTSPATKAENPFERPVRLGNGPTSTLAPKDFLPSTPAKANEAAWELLRNVQFAGAAEDALAAFNNAKSFAAQAASSLTDDQKKDFFFAGLSAASNSPETLKPYLAGGLDKLYPELSGARKEAVSQFLTDAITNIPGDKRAGAIDFVAAIAKDDGPGMKEMFSDSAKLAERLGIETGKVKDAQTTIADAVIKASGLDGKAFAALLDPKHPDSIVDKDGNLDITGFSKKIAATEADRQSIEKTGKTLAQNQEELNAGRAKAWAGQAAVNQGWKKIGGPLTALGAALTGRTEERNQGIRDAIAGQQRVNEGWAQINEGQRQLDEAITARDAGAREIQKQLEAKLPSNSETTKDFVRLGQDLLAHSSFAKPGATMEINKQTEASDPRFKFYTTSAEEKYSVYNGLHEGKPVVYQHKPGEAPTRVEDQLARTIVTKTQEWQNSIQALRTPPKEDPYHNQYTLNDGSVVALNKDDKTIAYQRAVNSNGDGIWNRLSAAEAQSLAARERSFTIGSSPKTGFADPNTRISLTDLQTLGSTASTLIPEDISLSRSKAGATVYKSPDGQDLYYQITDSAAFKTANPEYQGKTDIGRIAVYENNQWIFVPSSDTARLARIQNSMRFADKARP